MHLLIHTAHPSSREAYIFQHIFDAILGIDYKLTTQNEEFTNYTGPKISYGGPKLQDELRFTSAGLLSASGVQQQDITFANYKYYSVPFAVTDSIFPFDIFAASFYLLSRYEEYLPAERDAHHRFSGKSSLAFKNNFLAIPIIDHWAYEILEILLTHYPDLPYKKRQFVFQPTLDIDMPFYLKSEGVLRRMLKSVKLLLKGNLKALQQDPFDNYRKVLEWDKKYNLHTVYFLLMGNLHPYDVTIHKNKKPFYQLIRHLEKEHKVGLHPSYQSNINAYQLTKEKKLLEQVLGKAVQVSRQHYLKLSLPETYRNLIENGLKADYTMAFADEPGFRASTCTPFLWYDLERETITDLMVYPTAVMDQTLRLYKNLKPDEALQEIENLMNQVKRVNGTFISLWHNESISDFGVWKNWENVYIELLRMGKSS